MVFINGIKYACATCIKGHRSSNCHHADRPLFEIKKKGRPVTQCTHCRELRKTKQVHVKCNCNEKRKDDSLKSLSVKFPNGLRDVMAENVTDSQLQPVKHKVESLLNPCTCATGGQCICCVNPDGSSCCGSSSGNVTPPEQQTPALRRASSLSESSRVAPSVATTAYVPTSTGLLPLQNGTYPAHHSPHGAMRAGHSHPSKHFAHPPYPSHHPAIHAPQPSTHSPIPNFQPSPTFQSSLGLSMPSNAMLPPSYIPYHQRPIRPILPASISDTSIGSRDRKPSNPFNNYRDNDESNASAYSTDAEDSKAASTATAASLSSFTTNDGNAEMEGTQSFDDLVKFIYQGLDNSGNALNQQPAYGNSAQAFVESSACGCGDGCKCPDCVEHGNAELPIFPHSSASCNDPNVKLESEHAHSAQTSPIHSTDMQRSLSDGSSEYTLHQAKTVLPSQGASSCCSGRCGCGSASAGCSCGTSCHGCHCRPVAGYDLPHPWMTAADPKIASIETDDSFFGEQVTFSTAPSDTTSSTAGGSPPNETVPSLYLSHGAILDPETGELRCGCGCGRPFQQCERCWSELAGATGTAQSPTSPIATTKMDSDALVQWASSVTSGNNPPIMSTMQVDQTSEPLTNSNSTS